MSAAVADYKPATVKSKKIKKHQEQWSLELSKTPDILSEISKIKKPEQKVIGFALETDNEKINAQKKLESKKLDMIILNSLNDEGAGFATDTNKVMLITNKDQIDLPLKSKSELAQDIAGYIVDNMQL